MTMEVGWGGVGIKRLYTGARDRGRPPRPPPSSLSPTERHDKQINKK